MVISLTINRTTVELNTRGILWIETAAREVYAARLSDAYIPDTKELKSGEWSRKWLGWGIVSSPKN